jgi:hypothetical protein
MAGSAYGMGSAMVVYQQRVAIDRSYRSLPDLPDLRLQLQTSSFGFRGGAPPPERLEGKLRPT